MARDFDGKTGPDISIEAHGLWFDGSPLKDRVMIDKQGVELSLAATRYDPGDVPIQLENGQWLWRAEIYLLWELSRKNLAEINALVLLEEGPANRMPVLNSIP